MQLDEILDNFLTLTQDAVGVGYRGPDDASANLVYVNPAFSALFGFSADELLGGPVDVYHDPAHWDDYLARVRPFFASGEKQFSTETGCRRADGSTFWASLSFFVVDDAATGGRFSCAVFRDISDLKAREDRAEEALAEHNLLLAEKDNTYEELLSTQNRLLSAMNAYPDPFVIYDKDQILITSNRAFNLSMSKTPERIQPGMSSREVLAVACEDGIFDVPLEERDRFIDDLLADRNLSKNEQYIEMKGDIHHRLLRSVAENGDYVVLRLDVTQLVRQQRLVGASHRRLLSAIEAYPSPFCIYNSDHRLVVWNDSYAESITDTPEDLYEGMPMEEVMRNGLRSKRFADAMGREEEWLRDMVASARAVVPVEDIALSGDRHQRLLRSLSADGDLVMLRIDTTELVRQRRALQATQDRLFSAINAFPDPFGIYDKDVCLAVWNPAFESSLRAKPGDLQVGMHVSDVIKLAVRNGCVPQSVGREEAWLGEYITPDLSTRHEEEFEFGDDEHYRILRSKSESGEILVVRLNITEQVRQRRELQNYAKQLESANQEITHTNEELEEALQKSRAAEQAKSDFLAAMSHEIRTPMNGVLGMSDLLSETILDRNQHDLLATIQSSGRALLGIINDILDYSKIDSGHLELRAAPFWLADLVDDPSMMLSVQASTQDVRIFVRVDPALPLMAHGDLPRLKQVVTNLISNAVKFTQDGYIYVNMSRTQFDGGVAALRVDVQDTGCGIPKEKLRYIFEKFTQIDSSFTRPHEGTGLGLAISKGMIGLLGGEIWATSELGQGSTFSFQIPLEEAGADTVTQLLPPDQVMAGRRVLIVDPYAQAADILAERLTAWGGQVQVACTIEAALAQATAQSADFDMMFVSPKLPDVEQDRSIDMLCAAPALKGAKVIEMAPMMSMQPGNRVTGHVDAALTKPVSLTKLTELIWTLYDPHVVTSPQDAAPAQAADLSGAAADQPDILVVDDNRTNLKLVQAILRKMGVAQTAAQNGQEAFDLYKQHHPRLLLMDISMPVMNGLDATAHIRRYEEEQDLPRSTIIGLTAHTMASNRQACLDHGMDDHMPKPISIPALRGAVTKALNRAG